MPIKLVYSRCIFYLIYIFFTSQLQAQNGSKIDFSFSIPQAEINCMQYFDETAQGRNPINTFLLAKFSEMMYLERLDYQLYYMQNNQKVVDSIPHSEWIKKNSRVSNENFELAFKTRFAHYFYNPAAMPQKAEYETMDQVENRSNTTFNLCFWQDSTNWAKEHIPEIKFIHRTAYLNDRKWKSLDPELVVISTPKLILIIYRGTDPTAKENEWGEWVGTDFRIGLVRGGGGLIETRIHKGFWQSFDLIRDELIRALDKMNAKNKSIWLTGHSLGGAMAILTGAYLKSENYPITNIYAYASPRAIGNKKFSKKVATLLPHKIQRFEYYLDPITLLWAPRYGKVGVRNWFDDEEYGSYKLYENIKERYIHLWPFHFNRYPLNQRKQNEMRLFKEMYNGMMTEVPFRFYYHNPQYYVKAAYHQLSKAQKAVLPAVDDSYPYLYGSAKGPMPGTK